MHSQPKNYVSGISYSEYPPWRTQCLPVILILITWSNNCIVFFPLHIIFHFINKMQSIRIHFEAMHISSSSSNLLPMLVSIDGSFLTFLYYGGSKMVIFQLHHSLYIYQLTLYCKKSLFPYWFVYLFIICVHFNGSYIWLCCPQ